MLVFPSQQIWINQRMIARISERTPGGSPLHLRMKALSLVDEPLGALVAGGPPGPGVDRLAKLGAPDIHQANLIREELTRKWGTPWVMMPTQS